MDDEETERTIKIRSISEWKSRLTKQLYISKPNIRTLFPQNIHTSDTRVGLSLISKKDEEELYSKNKNIRTIGSNYKLERHLKYFLNPEIKTKWRELIIQYVLEGKETSFNQFFENTRNIYDDERKLRKLEENFNRINFFDVDGNDGDYDSYWIDWTFDYYFEMMQAHKQWCKGLRVFFCFFRDNDLLETPF